jgi:hypothetical protein
MNNQQKIKAILELINKNKLPAGQQQSIFLGGK